MRIAVTIDGAVQWYKDIEIGVQPEPKPDPIPDPLPPVTPPTPTCQPGDTREPVLWAFTGARTQYFCIPENRPTLLINAVGMDNNTDALLTWTFPDGRVFPTDPEFGKILGTGTYSVKMHLRSQSSFSPTIPDQYIPAGRHKMEIKGYMSGKYSVEW